MVEPLISNERGDREWLYLCSRVGEERARAAIHELKGGQRPYPLNIASALGIALPEEALLPRLESRKPTPEQLAKHLAALRAAVK
ncbi:hypothetical protein [Thiocystis violacea]|uniref:hypothetical protein n=1 Tax=Thiocystis violacea TaxID=13725 RepID=UPI0019081153|nr:hypothetical protein [Thiocystis violacea]MBK1724762.1 hypothetical protein [Thiocystis violacea]